MHGSLHALLGPNRVVVRSGFCTAFSVLPRAKTAGNWPNTPERLAPLGMQRLLSSAVWDTDGVRDDLRTYTLEHLGNQSAIVAIDETSFPKKGKKSAGVGVQYCGTTGQVENCQVGVFLAYVTAKGHTLIDRELYLPLDWTEDLERCQADGIPESV